MDGPFVHDDNRTYEFATARTFALQPIAVTNVLKNKKYVFVKRSTNYII